MSTDPFEQPSTDQPNPNGPVHAEPADAATPVTSLGMGGVPYEPQEPAPAKPPSKALLGVAAAGLMLAGFGVVRAILAEPKPRAPRDRVESVWSEQVRTGQQAMDLAEELQQTHDAHAEVIDELNDAAAQLGAVDDATDQ